jgi:heme/copper-type cytochrome/quinol oxidase subunit 3
VKRALLVDIGSENWEAAEQRMKKMGKMDVSNWVILSVLLGYTFWASVLYILAGGD